ncbi:MAG: PEGA domain-containing protein [Alphaproteobacteria bacterium]|nr:PEGA domain-containing protein [Alphaproteobacteria bacterium]
MTRWCSVGLLFLSQYASATELVVKAKDGQKAVVLVDEYVKGEAPVTTTADAGEVEVAFRMSMFGPVLFSEKITVPASGSVELLVDMEERTVEVVSTTAPEPAPAPKPAPEPAPKPKPAPEPAPVSGLGPAPEPGAGEGIVTVKASKEGLPISVDGKDTGKKVPAHLPLAPGKHVVKIAQGCFAGEKEFQVSEGEKSEISVDLAADKAMLAVRSDPSGATIYLDGKELGVAPMDARLTCGERTFKATKDGYLAIEKTVDVGTDESVSFELQKDAWGSLEVSVEPADAAILLDGDRVGTGKATLDKVQAGSHTLTIERKGKEVEKRTVEVGEGKSVVLALVVSADTKGPKEPKAKGNGPKVAPIVIGGVGIVGSIPLVGLGVYNYSQARIAYDDYLTIEDEAEADRIFKEEVAPRQTVAFAEWAAGGVLLAGGAALVTVGFLDGDGLYAAPTPNGFVIGGRF